MIVIGCVARGMVVRFCRAVAAAGGRLGLDDLPAALDAIAQRAVGLSLKSAAADFALVRAFAGACSSCSWR